MSSEAPDTPPRGRQGDRQGPPRLPGAPGSGDQSWRWLLIVLGGLVIVALLLSPFFNSSSSKELSYSELRAQIDAGKIKTAEVDNASGRITGLTVDGKRYVAN